MAEWELNVLQTTKGPFLDRLEKKTIGEITPSKVGNNVQVSFRVIFINFKAFHDNKLIFKIGDEK